MGDKRKPETCRKWQVSGFDIVCGKYLLYNVVDFVGAISCIISDPYKLRSFKS